MFESFFVFHLDLNAQLIKYPFYYLGNSEANLQTTNLQSSGKNFKKHYQPAFEHEINDKGSTSLKTSSCEKEIVKSSITTANSSKMISTDAYLPTHSASSVNTTLNLTAITLGSANDSDSLPPPPPSYSRLPPDGHEFPPDYKDPSCTTSTIVYRVSLFFGICHNNSNSFIRKNTNLS